MRTTHRTAGAFTLIELLVVISVIILLAALTLPVLTRATAQARAAECMSNLHQLAVAFTQYAHNHRGRLPGQFGEPPGNTWLQLRWWTFESAPKGGQLWPYYREERLVLCPSDDGGNGRFSYSCPAHIGYRIIWQAEKPTESVLVLGEHEKYHIGAWSREGSFGSIDRPSLRHRGRTPVGFFDGHASLHKFPAGFIAYDLEVPPWGFVDR